MNAPHRKRWQVKPPIPVEIASNLMDFSPLARQVLFNRGITTSDQAIAFISVDNTSRYNPFELTGMKQAVERIQLALDKHQKIAIYGDYDVDGVTATALLVECMTTLGIQVRPYIPNRFEEGYGVNSDALVQLKQEGVDLVITVDCGARSPVEAQLAREIGLDLIITDHHIPGEILPDVVALINPKQPGDAYPDKDLAGVGLAFKLAEALASQFHELEPDRWLDLVALGTVADMALLQGENRVLVKKGLGQIQRATRQGIVSLAGVSGIDITHMTATNIGFALGPRLNAAGRLETALDAYQLLISTDPNQAGRLAQQLQLQNQTRRKLTAETQDLAAEMALVRNPSPWVVFAYSPEFNEGVIGLAASRLVDRFYRPALVGTIKGEMARFSCRSIPEVHITQVLDGMADLFIRHGGHSAAAGLSIQVERIAEFQSKIETEVARQLTGMELSPNLTIDQEIRLENLRPRDYFEIAERIEPVGIGNPEILLVSRHVRCTQKARVGQDKQTLKLKVLQGGITYDAIAFQQGDRLEELGEFIDLVYTLGLDTYPGREGPRVQLMVKDLRPAETNAINP